MYVATQHRPVSETVWRCVQLPVDQANDHSQKCGNHQLMYYTERERGRGREGEGEREREWRRVRGRGREREIESISISHMTFIRSLNQCQVQLYTLQLCIRIMRVTTVCHFLYEIGSSIVAFLRLSEDSQEYCLVFQLLYYWKRKRGHSLTVLLGGGIEIIQPPQ